MFDTYEIHREAFEKGIRCLDAMIATVYSQITLSKISEILYKYKESVTTNPSASTELKEIYNESTKEVLKSISKEYRIYLLKAYFSDMGLMLYIFARIRDLSETQVNNVLGSLQENS